MLQQQQSGIIRENNKFLIAKINSQQVLKLAKHNSSFPNICTKYCEHLQNENYYQLEKFKKNKYILQHQFQLVQNEIYQDSNFKTQQGCYVIMELAKCDLFDEMYAQKDTSFEQLKKYVYQMCQGIKILHENGISHNDIKIDNFFYFEEEDMVKLGDFGFASQCKVSEGSEIENIFGGKNEFVLSPEVSSQLEKQKFQLLPQKISLDLRSGDIYNFGLVLFEIVYKVNSQFLFNGYNRKCFFAEEKFFTKNDMQAFFYPLIKQCIIPQPEFRINIQDLCEIITDEL